MAVTQPPKRDTASTLHISLPLQLERELREVAWRLRRPLSHLCRDFIEEGLKKLAKTNEVAAEAIAAVSVTK